MKLSFLQRSVIIAVMFFTKNVNPKALKIKMSNYAIKNKKMKQSVKFTSFNVA